MYFKCNLNLSKAIKNRRPSTARGHHTHGAHESTELTSFFLFLINKLKLHFAIIMLLLWALFCRRFQEWSLYYKKRKIIIWRVLQTRLIHEAATDLKSRPVPQQCCGLTVVLTPNMRKYLSLLQLSQDIPFRLRYQYISEEINNKHNECFTELHRAVNLKNRHEIWGDLILGDSGVTSGGCTR